MEKKVGSLDLDELKKAREELNRERGIETDPHMYDNYNPDRNTEESNSETEDAVQDENIDAQDDSVSEDKSSDFDDAEKLIDSVIDSLDDVSEGSDETNSNRDMTPSEKNFDAYDSFSDFEVSTDDVDFSEDEPEPKEVEKTEKESDSEPFSDNDVDAFIKDVFDGENDDAFVVDSITDNGESDESDTNESTSDETEKPNNETETTTDETDLTVENNSQPDEFDKFKAFEVGGNFSDDADDETSSEMINDFKKLNEMLEEDDKKAEELERLAEEEIIEKNKSRYKFINEYEFVDTIATDDFKESDALSFIVGKDEDEKIVYANIRDIYSTAVFGTDKDKIFAQLSSIILSLSLKNNTEDINFVICDSKAASKYDVFNDSSFMYFNRVAKTNKEIIDSLVELVRELENRYKTLVDFGVKSIEAYNNVAKENDLKTMPYILTVFSNYTKASQLADAHKINNCLTNILKLGRIVGMYLIINADFEIKNQDINYNLPTRITYKSQNEEDSISALGEGGAEWLPDDGDILYYNIYERAPKHLKIPNLTSDEIKLIIENIEN